MPEFCDVALPVPVEMVFTYRVGDTVPVIGGRVLVPFRTTRMAGIVTALHARPPSIGRHGHRRKSQDFGPPDLAWQERGLDYFLEAADRVSTLMLRCCPANE